MTDKNQDYIRRLLKDTSFINWAKGTNKNDIEYWNSIIQKNPQRIESIETAKSIILGIKFTKQLPSCHKVNQEFNKVLDKLQEETTTNYRFSVKGKIKALASFSTAAIVLFIITWSGFTLYQDANTTVHKTNFGEIIDLKLPDGTSVVLNGNSEIRYANADPRNITLQGEAYFKVKSIPSTNAKFWVNTNDLMVEVLGTQFHVNTRMEKTKVVLDEGSVHLEFKNGDLKKMVPGELVSFSKASETVVYKKVSASTSYALWKDGTYTFNAISLEEVMSNLEYTYGIQVTYSTPKLKLLALTGGVPNHNLKICIAAIEKATGTRIIKKENTLLIQENSNY
ncbi:MAG: transmembrane sensor [Maribacter sp.]|jgi:transmembrane sensor